MATYMKRCDNIGILGTCPEKIYTQRNPEETLCFYHAKVRDGLLEAEDPRAVLLELGTLNV